MGNVTMFSFLLLCTRRVESVDRCAVHKSRHRNLRRAAGSRGDGILVAKLAKGRRQAYNNTKNNV